MTVSIRIDYTFRFRDIIIVFEQIYEKSLCYWTDENDVARFE